MAIHTCDTCNKRVVEVSTRDGEEIELVEYAGPQLWATKYEAVKTPDGVKSIAIGVKAKAFVIHECTRMPETLGAAVRVQEFPSLGDPV